MGAPGVDVPHRWVADERTFADLVAELRRAPAYGLDTEFHRERTYFAKLALLQLSWPDGLAVVDPLAVDVGPLAEVLDGPGTCVMHAGAQDLEILQRHCGTLPRVLFDTQVAAGFVGYSGAGLGALVSGELGIKLPKADRLTDWLNRPLPPGAANYAAADVAHLLELHDRLVRQLEERGRLEWARSECELLRARYAQPTPPERAWWRIKEARSLRGQPAAVAQSLAAWRERRAAQVDRPIRTVLADLALVAMAQRPPKSEEDLRRVRGLDDRHRRGGAAKELLGAVREGLELDPDMVQMPTIDAVDRSKRAAASIVASWITQRARELSIDPAILATRSDVETFLDDGSGRLGDGWRADVVAEPVRMLAEGRASVALDGEGRLVLEERSGRPVRTAL
jgi:ribonuclease D